MRSVVWLLRSVLVLALAMCIGAGSEVVRFRRTGGIDVRSGVNGRRKLLAAATAAAAAHSHRKLAAPAATAEGATVREQVVADLLSRIPVYVVANALGEPYLTEVDSDGRRSGGIFVGPRDAAEVLGRVRAYDASAQLAVVPLSTVYSGLAKTDADGASARASAPQPSASTSRDLRLFQLRPLSDEPLEAVSMLPGASMLPGVALFYEPDLFLGTDAQPLRPYFFRRADLARVWRSAHGDGRNDGQVSPSLRVVSLEKLLGQAALGELQIPPLLMPPSETAELEYTAGTGK